MREALGKKTFRKVSTRKQFIQEGQSGYPEMTAMRRLKCWASHRKNWVQKFAWMMGLDFKTIVDKTEKTN